ncbi:MAG: tetratricopeptide repeat protein [Rhodanobacteraceae bacterium]|nr:tetratricopeptide repeat protein [Rhodanobacteraceae bacterium]
MLQDLARLHSEGRFDEAESGYRAVLASEPDNVDALHLLGLLRRQRQDLGEARRLLDQARRLAPERGDVALELAGLYFLEQDLIGARALIEHTIKQNPNQPGAHTLLARIAIVDNDLTKAETLFRTALRSNENDAHAISGLGRLLLDRGEVDKSVSYLSRAVELAPRDAGMQFALARALVLRGNRAFGEQAARNALAIAPELHGARYLLAQVLLEDGKIDEAQAAFAVLSEAPGFQAIARFGLGDVARQQGRLDPAIEHYRAGLALDPDQPRALQLLGNCLILAAREAEALQLYDEFLQRHPETVAIEAAQAELLSQLGQDGSALAIWQRLAQRRPNDPIPLARLALLHERGGDTAGADLLAQRVAAALPEDVDLILLRARSAQREGRDSDATALLESLRRLQLAPMQVMQAAHQFGVLADRRDEVHLAVPAWLESQSTLPLQIHEQPVLPESFAASLAVPAPAPLANPPIFLVGLPGSMVERVAALLHQQSGVQLLRDRMLGPLRRDAFAEPDFAGWAEGIDASAAEAVRTQWQAELVRLGADPQARIVDWLVRWDARFLPLIRQAFPGATIVIVERDPRDLLLNWLAYGWMQGFALHDPVAAAGWIKRATVHLEHCKTVDGVNVLRISADAVLGDPASQGAALAAVLGLAELAPGMPQRGLGGLPIGLAPGRWQAYAEVLAAPLAELGTSP